ncbi:MAG: hypothetical protein ABSB35_38490 [Bryobacteraceae bacterium]|jgi:hypothetical protein
MASRVLGLARSPGLVRAESRADIYRSQGKQQSRRAFWNGAPQFRHRAATLRVISGDPSNEGLDRFRELPVVTYSVHQGLSNLPTGPVLAAKDGSIWIGTRNGLNRMNNRQVTGYDQRGVRAKDGPNEIAVSGLPDHGLGSLFQDSRGRGLRLVARLMFHLGY